MAGASRFFSAKQQDAIRQAIEEAEKNTSGEIRVHIDETCKGEVVPAAQKIFVQLGMDQTRDRNGVLFYLAVKDHKFAIIGDQGIHQRVPEGFWDTIRDNMEARFSEKLFTEGLCEGIRSAGEQLKQHFPYRTDDLNELGNEVTFNRE